MEKIYTRTKTIQEDKVSGFCPTNWGMNALQSLDFIEQKMLPEYPLGVVRDRSKEEV